MLKERLKLGILKTVGTPSLSTIMHTAALQQLNINAEYKPYETKPEDLKVVFEKLKKEKVKGLNVTLPHKINIIPFLDKLTDRAKSAGAVNTIIFKEETTIGDNTDINGFWNAIPEEVKQNIAGKSISILGCGGAAHACIISFISKDISKIIVYGRDRKKLDAFENFIKSKNSKINFQVKLFTEIDLSDTYTLVNTTPVGMYPNINETPVKKQDLQKLPKDALVYDIIYNPLETKLLQDAKALSLKTLNGVEMLVRQGAESLNIWLEKDIAPIEIMRNAVLDSLEVTT